MPTHCSVTNLITRIGNYYMSARAPTEAAQIKAHLKVLLTPETSTEALGNPYSSFGMHAERYAAPPSTPKFEKSPRTVEQSVYQNQLISFIRENRLRNALKYNWQYKTPMVQLPVSKTRKVLKHFSTPNRRLAKAGDSVKMSYSGSTTAWYLSDGKVALLEDSHEITQINRCNLYDKPIYLIGQNNTTKMESSGMCYMPEFKAYVLRRDPRLDIVRIIGNDTVYVTRANAETLAQAWGLKIARNVPLADHLGVSVDDIYVVTSGAESLCSDGQRNLWLPKALSRRQALMYCGRCSSYSAGRCSRCGPREVRQYNFDVTNLHKFNEKGVRNGRYFGVEVELEPNTVSFGGYTEKMIKEVEDSTWCMKRDGSIGSGGCEYVSAPSGVDTLRTEFTRLMGTVAGNLMCSSSRTGLHVHVTRDTLTEWQLFLMREFLRMDNNQQFVTELAGRPPNNYCQRKFSPDKTRQIVSPKTGNIIDIAADSGKYQALNVQRDNTVEFRLFQSTTDLDEFMTRLQFCDALAEFTASNNRKAESFGLSGKYAEYYKKGALPSLLYIRLQHGRFCSWLAQNDQAKVLWPELTTFTNAYLVKNPSAITKQRIVQAPSYTANMQGLSGVVTRGAPPAFSSGGSLIQTTRGYYTEDSWQAIEPIQLIVPTNALESL